MLFIMCLSVVWCVCVFFFFKQKTAYELRISDWSSDVCSSDLRNDSPDWLEGRYLLPLPEDAAVDALKLRIGERVIEGEVREKEQARALYAKATANGQHAGLVQAERPNLFRTAIGKIGRHTSELKSLMRNSDAVVCLKKKKV